MIRDITLGQYYQADSVIHRLDPRVKIIGTFIYIISLFIFGNFSGYAVAMLFLAIVVKLSTVPLKFMVKGLKAIVIIMIMTVILNVIFTPGEVLISFWKFNITKEGIKIAVRMIFRLTLLVMGTSVMTLTTTPSRLTDGLEKCLGFLNKFRVPVHEIAMMMSIALSFIPILLQETDKIMKAQMARGADFENGSIIRRIKNMIPLLVPLFVSAFRRAGDLALAMEARCYRGGDGRTKMKPLIYKKNDFLAYLILLLYLVGIIAVAVFVKI